MCVGILLCVCVSHVPVRAMMWPFNCRCQWWTFTPKTERKKQRTAALKLQFRCYRWWRCLKCWSLRKASLNVERAPTECSVFCFMTEGVKRRSKNTPSSWETVSMAAVTMVMARLHVKWWLSWDPRGFTLFSCWRRKGERTLRLVAAVETSTTCVTFYLYYISGKILNLLYGLYFTVVLHSCNY